MVLNLTSHALCHKAFRIRIGGVREMSAISSHPHISTSTRTFLAFLEAVSFLSLLGRCLFRHDWTGTNGQGESDQNNSQHWLLRSVGRLHRCPARELDAMRQRNRDSLFYEKNTLIRYQSAASDYLQNCEHTRATCP